MSERRMGPMDTTTPTTRTASAMPPACAEPVLDLPEELADLLVAAALQNPEARAALNFWVLGKTGQRANGRVKVERATFTPHPKAEGA